MALLPSLCVLQSGDKYLSLTENIPANLPSGLLKFDEEEISSPRVKFAVEPAAENGRFVHIRCCFNNKYLVMKQIETSWWMVASAEKPDGDTLLEPYSEEGDETTSVRLRPSSTSAGGSFISSDGEGTLVSSAAGSVFNAINWNSLLIFPTQVAFRSVELNESYLRSIFLYQGLVYQRFQAGLDIADPLVANELVPVGRNGNYRIIDLFTGRFWRRRDNWIKGENDNTTNESLFSFVHIHDNVFGLRNMGNNNLCGPFTEDQSIDCLNARFPNLTRPTWLTVEECVVRREIINVVYRLNDSRIYDEQTIEVNHAFADNATSREDTLTLAFTQTDSRTRSWSNSVSISFGVTTSVTISAVPFIVEGTIQTSTEIGYTHEWGVSETTETSRSANYTITVPPFTRRRVAMMATRGRCDVPFSYTQRDLRTSGNWVETRKHDGLFTGMNSYSFNFQSTKA